MSTDMLRRLTNYYLLLLLLLLLILILSSGGYLLPVNSVLVTVILKPKVPTYAHDTRSRNLRHKSTPFFWRRFLVRVSWSLVKL